MKTKLLLVTAIVCLAGCSLFSSPTATVKKFMAATDKGDVEAMTQLFSQKAVQRIGIERIRSDNEQFAEIAKSASSTNGKFKMENVRESTTATGKRVSFVYRSEKGNDSVGLVFDLSKESGTWKIDNIGGGGSEDATASPSPTSSLSESITEPPPPRPPASVNNQSNSASKRAPISGGILNGKAISLPKPPYPPAARAVKASGTVVVQVTVDENGNVISARAISGHPLLQAVAVTAARGAKFSPTKLSGEPVKVNGVITFQFTPE